MEALYYAFGEDDVYLIADSRRQWRGEHQDDSASHASRNRRCREEDGHLSTAWAIAGSLPTSRLGRHGRCSSIAPSHAPARLLRIQK
jgi:hypothetical protein